MIKARSFLAIAIVGCTLLIAGNAAVHAQAGAGDQGQGNGLKIAPVRTDLTIEKGSNRMVSLFVENITAFPMTVRGVTNDFVANTDESGEPRIILDEKESAPGNSFKTLVGPIASATLKPNERREIKVMLTVPKNAESGGYYGSIRFVPGLGDNDKNVALSASVGSIFLIRVPGNITEKLSVESFGVSRDGRVGSLFNDGPIVIETRFRNLGNVHVQPFGKIFVKNMSGKVIHEVELNNVQPRGSVLPTSIRLFSNPIPPETKLFGKYTVEGSFGYGSNGELIMAKKTFFIIPYKMIAAIAALVLFLLFGLPKLIRSYNQKIINQAKGKPKVRPKPKPKR